MTLLFGTLGATPDALLASVAARRVARVVFWHDRERSSRDAAEALRAACRERGIETEGFEIDAHDVLDSALAMRRALRRHAGDDVVFNVASGTPVLSSAATLTCILEGVRAVYVDARTGEEVALPLLTLRGTEILNREQRKVLQAVTDAGPEGCTQADVMKATRLSRATISHHVKNLKAKRLLRADPHPTDARKEVLRVLESAALLMDGA